MRTNSKLFASLFTVGLSTLGGLDAVHAASLTFDLAPINTVCLAGASGRVVVFEREDRQGVDSLQLKLRGLPPDTDFSVFLTSADAFAAPPFGAASYIASVTTNASGNATLKIDAIIGEAFVSKREGTPPVRVRSDLNHIVLWFSDPAQVPACFNFVGSTPFDGDGSAGPAVLSSRDATGLELVP